ncbi:GNAT family N-acetyltransferase [Dactylosporangium cerinum]|uniref:GNAT family N-acetyltransferase n=1 Tax=Dactylosporangium cerinum TaxID=1434730 RepID=A0ABV9W4X8_9ACTN
MTDAALLERAQRLWTELAGTTVTFHATGIDVAVSPQSWLCPPGWVGVVVLGNAAIATAPDATAAELVRRAVHDLPASALTDPATLRDRLPIDRTLGPATLAYCDPATFRPTVLRPADPSIVEPIPADHPDLATLLTRVPPEDAEEADLADITSPAFVIRGAAGILAAAGYRTWPRNTAHLSVLTATAERGHGLARAAASTAVATALEAGLLPQWRARPEASRRVARALGFSELGAQLSLRLLPADDQAPHP